MPGTAKTLDFIPDVQQSIADAVQAICAGAHLAIGGGIEDCRIRPSEEDTERVSQFLADTTTELKKLENLIATLSKEKEKLIETVHAVQQYFSPVLHLPTEIFQKIFLYSIDASRNCDAWDTQSKWWNGHRFLGMPAREWHELVPDRNPLSFGDSNRSPWSASRVCKRWRHIALSTPQLWSYIEFSPDQLDRPTQSTFSLLMLALERSKPVGLDLVLNPRYSRRLPKTILAILAQHIERWERLYSSAAKSEWSQYLNKISQGGASPDDAAIVFPRLKAVALLEDVFFPESKAPCVVTRVALPTKYGSALEWGEGSKGPIFKNYNCALQAMNKDPVILTHNLQAIGRIENLTTLRISLDDYSHSLFGWSDTSTCVVFPHVVSFSLGVIYSDTSKRFLSMLLTPALRSLYLLSLDKAGPLISLVERSSCSLSSLRIDEACLNGEDIYSILEHTPNIEDVHLSLFPMSTPPDYREIDSVGTVSDKLVERLFTSPSGGVTKLRKLTLLMIREINVDLVMCILERHFASELPPYPPLEHVVLGIAGYDERMLTSQHKNLLHSFQNRHRSHIVIKPWELRYDSDSSVGETESLAEFTDGSEAMSQSSLSDGSYGYEIEGTGADSTSSEGQNQELGPILDASDDSSSDYLPPEYPLDQDGTLTLTML